MRRLIWIFAGRTFPKVWFLTLQLTKTCLYNIDPLKPNFYIVKLGFTGVYIIFLISAQKNIDCGYSLEPPHRGGSNEYPQSMFWAEIRKISEFFLSEKFQFLEVKFPLYLNRHAFVMIIYKEGHFYVFLFVILHTNPFLKMGLL